MTPSKSASCSVVDGDVGPPSPSSAASRSSESSSRSVLPRASSYSASAGERGRRRDPGMSPGAPTDDGGDPSSRCSLHRGVDVVVVDGAVSPDGEESDGSSRRRYPTLLALSTPPPTALPFLRGGGDEEDVDVVVAASGSAQDLAKMSVFRRSDRSGAGGCDGGVETATSARSPSPSSLLEGDGDDERKRNEAEQAADDDDDDVP